MQNTANTVEYSFTASEFNWEVAPGKSVQAWGFNQQVPGPAIKARKGDTVVVKVQNNLLEPTIVHWHGVRLQASMDGTDEVQKPIEPGQTFEYRFVVPDAGTFWYHSHYNETVQMERGMYGSLIVEEETELVTDADRTFMIDDMKLTASNEFTQPGWFMPRIIERHDGREGDTLLINGKEKPVININAGQVERWRFINAASARYFRLYLGGKSFQIIATDGGFIEKPQTVTELLITPGERYEILVGAFEEGEEIAMESLGYNRVTFLRPKRETFATIRVGKTQPSKAFIPASLANIKLLAPQDAQITRKVKLSVGPSLKNGMDFLVNNDVHTHDEPVRVGELQVWEVSNVSLMDHPFHLHGFFFQVLEENGKPLDYLSWKDTYNLKPRTKVKIAWIADNRPGRWMYHCHILEHHAAGMMGHFSVVNGEEEMEHVGASCH